MEPTWAAGELVRRLIRTHGPVLLRPSSGRRDGSGPMCSPRGESRAGASDVAPGRVAGGTPFRGTPFLARVPVGVRDRRRGRPGAARRRRRPRDRTGSAAR
ncbi:DUF779 domain-containing protein [Streptomyces sp. NPDC086080]|uniref:DUF779 domain-containing protein n=1 Tax=Streptomyces sp. NPDC086080 TaxID=3365748 RepID=UPI0037D2D01F